MILSIREFDVRLAVFVVFASPVCVLKISCRVECGDFVDWKNLYR